MAIKSNDQMIGFGIALWVSFLLAGVASTLFFATFDPVIIASIATFPIELDALGGYSIGFLLFWLLLFVNSVIVIWLANHKPN